MTKRINLKNLIEKGILKPNEEVYMEFREFHFTARVTKEGLLKTEHGIFKSMSIPTFLNLMREPSYRKWYFDNICPLERIDYNREYTIEEERIDSKIGKRGVHVVGGWHLWRNWNGITLDKLREKLNNE